jgi:hypothetical protein
MCSRYIDYAYDNPITRLPSDDPYMSDNAVSNQRDLFNYFGENKFAYLKDAMNSRSFRTAVAAED